MAIDVSKFLEARKPIETIQLSKTESYAVYPVDQLSEANYVRYVAAQAQSYGIYRDTFGDEGASIYLGLDERSEEIANAKAEAEAQGKTYVAPSRNMADEISAATGKSGIEVLGLIQQAEARSISVLARMIEAQAGMDEGKLSDLPQEAIASIYNDIQAANASYEGKLAISAAKNGKVEAANPKAKVAAANA